jgi:hypothetical protein
MSESSSPPPPPGDRPNPTPGSERRRNVALRELIDEMMASIRHATQGNLWSAEERAQYERELAMIMSRVRTEAVAKPEASAEASAASKDRKD